MSSMFSNAINYFIFPEKVDRISQNEKSWN